MRKVLFLFIALSICAIPLLARADWEPDDPWTKWVQMPDPRGWDVKVTAPKILADDFECTSLDPIAGIHFWGSWRHDDVGVITRIHLSIHADIPDPDGPEGPLYSMPGKELWAIDIDPLMYHVVIREWGDGDQGWFDPNEPEYYIEHDHKVIWQVNVFLDEADWFRQEGTPEFPVVYWLDIQVSVQDPEYTDFGWKTSMDHWNDDAVWADWEPGWDPKWQELRDPITGESLDMAFVIATIPEPGILAIAGLGLLALLRRKK